MRREFDPIRIIQVFITSAMRFFVENCFWNWWTKYHFSYKRPSSSSGIQEVSKILRSFQKFPFKSNKKIFSFDAAHHDTAEIFILSDILFYGRSILVVCCYGHKCRLLLAYWHLWHRDQIGNISPDASSRFMTQVNLKMKMHQSLLFT